MVTEELGKTVLSPQEVRNILKTDNREIIKLCKQASIVPKKDKNGQTYFSYNEVNNLKNIQEKTVKSTALTQVDSQKVVNNLISSLSV